MKKVIIGNIEVKGKLLGKERFASGLTLYTVKISRFPHKPKIVNIISNENDNIDLTDLKVTV